MAVQTLPAGQSLTKMEPSGEYKLPLETGALKSVQVKPAAQNELQTELPAAENCFDGQGETGGLDAEQLAPAGHGKQLIELGQLVVPA